MSSAVDKNKNLDFTKDEKISKNNIDDWMFDKNKNNEYLSMNRADFKCSICGILLSKTKDSGGEKSIMDMLNMNDEIIGFYNLYTFKCPVKNIHLFESNKCTQCGVTKSMIFKNFVRRTHPY